MNSFTFPLPLINQDQRRRRRRRRTYSFFFERRTIRLQRFFVPQSDNLSFLDPETSPVPRLSLDPSADVKIRLRRYSESRASSIQSRDVSPWPTGARRESPLEEKEEAGKTDRARRPIAVETNGSGGRLRPLRRSTNYPHCLFAFYATALANDISRSARCLATTRIL